MKNPMRSNRAYNSTKRRITSCLECYRRKQKCDRKRPCTGCVSRAVPEKCVYHDDKTTPPLTHSQSPPYAMQTEPGVEIDRSQLQSLSSTLGYFTPGSVARYRRPNTTTIDLAGSHSLRRAVPTLNEAKLNNVAALLHTVPEPRTTRKLVDVFFNEANWYFSVLDRCFFDQRYREWLKAQRASRDGFLLDGNRYFPALLFGVLAIALQFVPQGMLLDYDMRSLGASCLVEKSREFSEAGDSLLTIYRRVCPDLSSVEADVMRCAWLKNSGFGIEAWHSLANAIRQAQDLGLYLEPDLSTLTGSNAEQLRIAWNCEHKRRVWACLITWEAHMALQLGRPRMLNLADCTAQRPTNCDAPIHMTRTLLRDHDSDDEMPSFYTSHIVKYDIALKIHRALSSGLLRSDTKQYGEVKQIHDEIRHLITHLPAALRYSDADTTWDVLYPTVLNLRLQIQIITDAFLLALHRPHIFNHNHSLNAAVHAAKNVLSLSEELFETLQEHQYKTFTLTFYMIDSGIFLVAALATFKSFDDDVQLSVQTLMDTLNLCVSRLDKLGKHHRAATSGQSILKNCLSSLRSSEAFGTIKRTTTPLQSDDAQSVDSHMQSPFDTLVDGQSDFWTNLMSDAAATSSWLDEYDYLTPG